MSTPDPRILYVSPFFPRLADAPPIEVDSVAWCFRTAVPPVWLTRLRRLGEEEQASGGGAGLDDASRNSDDGASREPDGGTAPL